MANDAIYKEYTKLKEITNEKISLSANCTSQDEVRLVRAEYDGIRKIVIYGTKT